MKSRGVLTAILMSIFLSASSAVADPDDHSNDIEGVKAASKSFYDAVVVVDDGTAMEKVWALKPYVTYVGPRSKSIIVGWDAQKKYWLEFNKASRTARSRWWTLTYTPSATSLGKLAPRSGRPK